jgi:hypothetical protein
MKTRYGALAIIAAMASGCLFSCGGSGASLSDYVVTLDAFAGKSEAKVLQLTDLHYCFNTDFGREKAYVNALVSYADPDLIMVTGDSILGATKETFISMMEVLDSTGVPYGFAWGNHDKQGYYPKDFPTKEAKNHPNCLYNEVDDDIYGLSNYVINLTDSSGSVKWQIYALDSNSLYPWGLEYQYDVIHDDQVAWYEEEVKTATENNGGTAIPSLMYFHIGLWEAAYASMLYEGQEAPGTLVRCSGELREKTHYLEGLGNSKVYPGYRDNELFEIAEELGSTKGMFFGHDHINDWIGEYYTGDDPSKAIAIGYGVKSSDELYYDKDMTGGLLATIGADGSVTYDRYFLAYSDSNEYSESDVRVEAVFA